MSPSPGRTAQRGIAPSPTATVSHVNLANVAAPAVLLLLVRLGERRFAIPAEDVLRVLPMAEPTALPAAPPGTIGVLPFRGALLPVVDPRQRLGLEPVAQHPSQHLVMIAAQTRYLLWIDRAETIITLPHMADLDGAGAASGTPASRFARIGDEYVPMIASDAFDPGSRSGAIDARPV
jgi:chemotaxis signal transduction protein